MKLIIWLEDLKIRWYGIDKREDLSLSSERWDTAFSNYLMELDCPFCWSEGSIDCIIWLIGYAVAVDYEFIDLKAEDSGSEMIVDGSVESPAYNDEIDRIGIESTGSLLRLPRIEQENDSG